jgi:predicted metal-dependent hydrolase
MRNPPPPIRDLELRDRLSELLGEALGKPERAAAVYVLRSFLRLVVVPGRSEVRSEALIGAVENAFREIGLQVSAQEAIEDLLNSKLLYPSGNDVRPQGVVPSEELQGELPAATLRAEAYCRALERLSRRQTQSTCEVERAIEEAACLFNEGLFFEVHEVLEAVWLKQGERVRPLLQGLIQIAVAFHHLENRNLKGALSLLREGEEKVRDYCPARFGLELEQFLKQTGACYHSIESLGSGAYDRFDRRMIPQMQPSA